MKRTVIMSFIDKYTNEPYNAGSVFESGDPVRINELQTLGYLLAAPVDEPEEEAAEEATAAAEVSEAAEPEPKPRKSAKKT